MIKILKYFYVISCTLLVGGAKTMKILIWNVRNEKGISLETLAALSKISKSALNNYENEKTSPTIHCLERIAKALGCRISDLYESDYK